MYSPTGFVVVIFQLLALSVIFIDKYDIVWSRLQNLGNEDGPDPQLVRREIVRPPITPQPACDQDDGLFYVTPNNSTFQIQCSTTYIGTVLGNTEASNVTDCILKCELLNTNVNPGLCVGVTFDGTDHGTTGNCTGYTKISNILGSADVHDSALLVLGPDGNEYASPAGSHTLSSTDDPLSTFSTSTTLGAKSTTVEPLGPTTSQGVLGPSSTPVVFSPIDRPNMLETVTMSTSSSSEPHYMLSTASQASTLTNNVSAALSKASQNSLTTTVAYTIYKVQPVVSCFSSPMDCITTTLTSTIVGYRTQISCPPGMCDNMAIAPGHTAAETAAICITRP